MAEYNMDDVVGLVNSFISQNYHKYAYLFGSVDDMRSELLLRLLKRLHKYDATKGKLSTFIFKDCKNCCKCKYRDTHAKCRVGQFSTTSLEKELAEDFTLADTISHSSNLFNRIEDRDEVLRYLQVCTAFTELAYIYDVPRKELARLSGVSEIIVNKHIYDDIVRIREFIKTGKRGSVSATTKERESKVLPLLQKLRAAEGCYYN